MTDGTLSFGRFQLDLDRRQLLRDQTPLRLGSRALDILCLLGAANGELVTKDELMSQVWPGIVVEENNLQVHVSALRKVLVDESGQSCIFTVPARGYRLVGFAPRVSVTEETGRQPSLALPRLRDRSSIAVLPFLNMSSDRDQEYFADGITEDIITALSKWRWFLVTARNSTFTYKGRTLDVAQIGRELCVRYVLEGSVRKAGARVRVTAQLIEAATGSHLWADSYDCDLTDIFAAQDEITRKVAAAVEPTLARVEGQIAARKPPEHLLAWDLCLRGLWHFYQVGEESLAAALECFQRAAELEELVDAHIGIARTLHSWAIYFAVPDRAEMLRNAELAARQALALDGDNAYAWYILAMVQATSRATAAALESARRAVELNPNLASAYFAMAVSSVYLGQHETTAGAIDTALRISPTDPQRFAWLATRASALYLMGRYAEAVETALQSRGLRRFSTASRVLAASYAQLGREAESATAVAEMLEEGSAERTISDVIGPFLRTVDREHYAEGLRKAGLPEV